MRDMTLNALREYFERSPVDWAEPVLKAEILAAAAALGCTFHEDYIEFIHNFGGAVLGANDVFGLRCPASMGRNPKDATVIEATQSFRLRQWPNIEGWYIISGDGRGNPIGIAPDGRVCCADHDCGYEVFDVARSFNHFVLDLITDDFEEELEIIT